MDEAATARAGTVVGVAPGEAVSLTSLCKRYGDLLAVKDVTLSLPNGTVTGLLGPNGAGKTTVLRVLLGMAKPSSGEALIHGRRYRDLDQPMRVVGAVLESGDFDPGRTGRDHLRVLALAAGLPTHRVDGVLELVSLKTAARRPVQTYSLGMRQRLGLAGALLGDPRLLVLDEPGNGLDPGGMRWLRSFLRAFAANGGTAIVSSHDLRAIAETVDRVVIMNAGRVVVSATLQQLVRDGRALEDVYLDATSEQVS